MSGSIRIYAFAIILVTLVIATAVLGSKGGTFSTGAAVPPDSSVNLIAYVDHRGRIQTVRPDGSNATRISPETGVFTWPSWSPDGRQIAFSGVTSDGDARGPLTLYVHRLGDDQSSVVYTNEPNIGPILTGMPHFPLWAPDSRSLAFMAGTPQGLTIFLDDLRPNSESQAVLRNSPLYAAWSSDSENLIVHGNVDHFLVEVGNGGRVTDLGIRSARYRTPAWRPSGNALAYVSEGAFGEAGLYSDEPTSNSRTLVDEASGNTAFLWSPDGESLAVARSGQASGTVGGFIYEGVTLFSPGGARQPLEINDNVFAYFWSPDSAKLAYITLAENRSALRWNILNVVDGTRWPLVDFIPSRDQLSIFQFFDQFAYSHSMWSPDSRSLLFAGAALQEGATASLTRQPVSRIIVLDTEPEPVPLPIADGFMATWSPR